MKSAISFQLICLLACFSTAAIMPAAAAPGMPAGAFLRHPAPDAQTLNREIATDPLVCGRYARLYNMSPKMVRLAFAHMRLTQLTEDRVFRVHYVHAGEKIGYKVRRVRKGTPIYILADGTPVLIRVCGNPLQIHPPKVVESESRSMPEMVGPQEAPDFSETEALSPAETTGLPETGALRSASPGEEVFPVVASIPPVTPPIAGPALANEAVGHISHFAGNTGLFFLPAAGVLGALASLHSSSGPVAAAPILTPPVTGPVSTPPVVTPPVVTPPIITPPVVVPPITTPPVVIPPIVTPPIVTPPVVTPPITKPPVTTPVGVTGGITTTPEPGAFTSGIALFVAGAFAARRRRAR